MYPQSFLQERHRGMDTEQSNRTVRAHRARWHRLKLWLLVLWVLSALILGPFGLLMYMPGLLHLYLLYMLLAFLGAGAWPLLLATAIRRSVRGLRTRQNRAALFWLSLASGTVLAFAVQIMGKTPYPIFFEDGVVRRLEMRTDVEAIQAWVESLGPDDYPDEWWPRGGAYVPPVRFRHLSTEEQPEILKCQDGMVQLELDREDRFRVRLSWYEGRFATWGLLIGPKDMEMPRSERGPIPEGHVEFRPGMYFWHRHGG